MPIGRNAGLAAILAFAVMAFALPIALPRAQAEHTPHHRYFIVGVVTNDQGQPVCGAVVRAADTASPKADGSNNRTATTDASGTYEIQLHEHDGIDDAKPADLNDTIRVSVESAGQWHVVKATPNAGNANGWGQLAVEFSLPTAAAGSCPSLGQIALWGGAGAAGLALVAGTVWFVRRPRRVGGGDLRRVQGIGRARARELSGMGIRSVSDLAGADPKDIAQKSSLTPTQAKSLVKRASEIQGEKR